MTLDRTRAADTFFPNGGAFAVTRDAYHRAGGFDDAFFAYYDDVDLGWRLRLVGLDMRVEDAAIVYHRHGATSRTQPAGQKRFLMERNALWTLLKNYGEATLRRTLGPVLLLATRRLLDEARLDERAAALTRFAPFSRRVTGTATFDALYASGSEAASAPAAAADRVVLGLPAESLAAHRRGDRHPVRDGGGAATASRTPRRSASATCCRISGAPSRPSRASRPIVRSRRRSSTRSICRASSRRGRACSSSATRPSPPTCRGRRCASSRSAGR